MKWFWITLRILASLTLFLLAIFPIYWMVLNSFLPTSELFLKTPRFLPVFGDSVALIDVFTNVPILDWLRTSIVVAAGTTALSLALSIFSAYALSRFQFRGKEIFGFSLFATQMLPEALIVIPYYTMFMAVGLINSLPGLVVANTAFIMPILVWVLKGAIDAVPAEIEEAARVDGCTYLDTQFSVVIPLILPSLAAAAVIAFFYSWNEYLFASTLIFNQQKWTTSVGLAAFIGELSTPLDTVMAAATVFTIPAVIFYLLVQRYVVSGMTAGAVKG